MLMLELSFWIVYLATPLIMIFLLKMAGEKIYRVSLINIVVLVIYAFSVIGTLPLFYRWDEYRAEIGIVNQDLIFLVLICSSMNIIFMLAGVVLSVRVIGVNSVNIHFY
jgi:hypothetical protein